MDEAWSEGGREGGKKEYYRRKRERSCRCGGGGGGRGFHVVQSRQEALASAAASAKVHVVYVVESKDMETSLMSATHVRELAPLDLPAT